MICKECGEKIEGVTRVCPHCGQRALLDDELDTWNFIADTAAEHRRAMPAEVVLNEPAAIPADRDAQIAGLERLKEYFIQHGNLYQVVQDLDYMERGLYRPTLALWLFVGGLIATLIYVPLSPFLPHFVWTYYFVLWGAVTAIGYLRSGRRYERRKAEYAMKRRCAENDLYAMYNGCADCFLPLDWTPPPHIIGMISALRTGEFSSVQEYMRQRQVAGDGV